MGLGLVGGGFPSPSRPFSNATRKAIQKPFPPLPPSLPWHLFLPQFRESETALNYEMGEVNGTERNRTAAQASG